MYTFGVGSLLDLPNFSVIVSGTDDWDDKFQLDILEDRLLGAIRGDPTLDLSQVKKLRGAPWLEETRNPFEQWAWVGVPVLPFPRWMRCSACNVLTTVDSGLLELTLAFRPDRARYVHQSCTKRGKSPPAIPARFVVACENGHLDEFPWVEFVHSQTGGKCPNGDYKLRAMDAGAGSRSTDVIVECLSCGTKRSLTNAFNENAKGFLPQCRGRHPHLRQFEEGCPSRVRPLLLGASNVWFPVNRSVLSIPTTSDPVAQAVQECWNAIEDPNAPIDSREVLAFAVARDQRLRKLKAYPLERVWDAIVAARAREIEAGEPDVLAPEWNLFATPETAPESDDFRLGPVGRVRDFPGVAAVVPVERLREVIALCGFTRVEGPDSLSGSEAGAGAGCAPLSRRKLDWLPAAEVRGEGIFVRLDEVRIVAWLNGFAKTEQCAALMEAHRNWRKIRGLASSLEGWPGARYLLVHSLSHAMIHELALECGYSAASIRERIYAREPDSDGNGAMAGFLLYTAAPDSEGTLGGLVALAEPEEFNRLLDAAFTRLALCSADPMCAGHLPSEAEITLHAAACHACLFVPETSCERANRYLDRSVLVATVAGRKVEYPFRG